MSDADISDKDEDLSHKKCSWTLVNQYGEIDSSEEGSDIVTTDSNVSDYHHRNESAFLEVMDKGKGDRSLTSSLHDPTDQSGQLESLDKPQDEFFSHPEDTRGDELNEAMSCGSSIELLSIPSEGEDVYDHSSSAAGAVGSQSLHSLAEEGAIGGCILSPLCKEERVVEYVMTATHALSCDLDSESDHSDFVRINPVVDVESAESSDAIKSKTSLAYCEELNDELLEQPNDVRQEPSCHESHQLQISVHEHHILVVDDKSAESSDAIKSKTVLAYCEESNAELSEQLNDVRQEPSCHESHQLQISVHPHQILVVDEKSAESSDAIKSKTELVYSEESTAELLEQLIDVRQEPSYDESCQLLPSVEESFQDDCENMISNEDDNRDNIDAVSQISLEAAVSSVPHSKIFLSSLIQRGSIFDVVLTLLIVIVATVIVFQSKSPKLAAQNDLDTGSSEKEELKHPLKAATDPKRILTLEAIWRTKYEDLLMERAELDYRIIEMKKQLISCENSKQQDKPSEGLTTGRPSPEDVAKEFRPTVHNQQNMPMAEVQLVQCHKKIADLRNLLKQLWILNAEPHKHSAENDLNEHHEHQSEFSGKELRNWINDLRTENEELKVQLGKIRYSESLAENSDHVSVSSTKMISTDQGTSHTRATESFPLFEEIISWLKSVQTQNYDAASKRQHAHKEEAHSHENHNHRVKSYPVFVTFLRYFAESSTNATHLDLQNQIDTLQNVAYRIGGCINYLDNSTTMTFYDIISLNWQEVEEHVSTEDINGKNLNFHEAETLLNSPCNSFIEFESLFQGRDNTIEKPDLKDTMTVMQNYINKTLKSVKKIGQSIKTTFDKIKSIPGKIFSESKTVGQKFGENFKNKLNKMNLKFKSGYEKLSQKFSKKFKSSIGKLSETVRSGLEKVSKRLHNTGNTLLRRKKQNPPSKSEDKYDPVPKHALDIKDKHTDHMNLVGEIKDENSNDNLNKGHHEKDDVTSSAASEGEQNKCDMMKNLNGHVDGLHYLELSQWKKKMKQVGHNHFNYLNEMNDHIWGLGEGELELLDDRDVEIICNDLMTAASADDESTKWVHQYLRCQSTWWLAFQSHNFDSMNLLSGCAQWLYHWQGMFNYWSVLDQECKPKVPYTSENEDLFQVNETPLPKHSQKQHTISNDEEPEMKDSNWYFRRVADHNPSWYFEIMEARESGRHDSSWYLNAIRRSLQKKSSGSPSSP